MTHTPEELLARGRVTPEELEIRGWEGESRCRCLSSEGGWVACPPQYCEASDLVGQAAPRVAGCASGGRVDGLTPEEGLVLDALGAAVGAFARLPVQHPCDLDEFVLGIHLCQGLLATRVARAQYPLGWPVRVARG